jgi:hypothetical protein
LLPIGHIEFAETSKETGIEENTIRKFFEENLITSSGTRGTVHRGPESTGRIPNTAVDILEKKYLIRKEERSGALWYELAHDRFIKPILDSNKQWKDKLEKTFAELWRKAVSVSKLQSENVDQVLAAFYEIVIKNSIKRAKHRIPEKELRDWCEKTLITPEGTRDVVRRENGSIGGIPSQIVGVLEKEYLIIKKERSGTQWYELTHDRLIKPIVNSNKEWEIRQQMKVKTRRNRIRMIIIIPIILFGGFFLLLGLQLLYTPIPTPQHPGSDSYFVSMVTGPDC